MPKQRWSWARSEIATLDPRSDAQRMAHLSFEVRFGTPIFLHALFNVAFAYNMGIPDTARILYREGRGTIMRRTRKRNFDSMIFFGELYRHGDSPEGVAICERLNRIHANFPIHNDLSLYTLATLACLPYRIGQRFAGLGGPSYAEYEAQFNFWCRIGQLLNIQNIPETLPAFMTWMQCYEKKHFAHTLAADAVVEAMADEWADYWFPASLQHTAKGVFLHLIDPEVRERMQLKHPTAGQRFIGDTAIKAFFLAKRMLPDPEERSMVEFFAQNYAVGSGLESVGVDVER